MKTTLLKLLSHEVELHIDIMLDFSHVINQKIRTDDEIKLSNIKSNYNIFSYFMPSKRIRSDEIYTLHRHLLN